jgi:hypothetical protein
MILWLEILTFCEQAWQKDNLNLVSPSAVFLQGAALTAYQGCQISVKDLLGGSNYVNKFLGFK